MALYSQIHKQNHRLHVAETTYWPKSKNLVIKVDTPQLQLTFTYVHFAHFKWRNLVMITKNMFMTNIIFPKKVMWYRSTR